MTHLCTLAPQHRKRSDSDCASTESHDRHRIHSADTGPSHYSYGSGSVPKSLQIESTPRHKPLLLADEHFRYLGGDGHMQEYRTEEGSGAAHTYMDDGDDEDTIPGTSHPIWTPGAGTNGSFSPTPESTRAAELMYAGGCGCSRIVDRALEERAVALEESAASERKLSLMTERRDHYARRFYRAAEQCQQLRSNLNTLVKELEHAHEQQRILADALKLVTDTSRRGRNSGELNTGDVMQAYSAGRPVAAAVSNAGPKTKDVNDAPQELVSSSAGMFAWVSRLDGSMPDVCVCCCFFCLFYHTLFFTMANGQ